MTELLTIFLTQQQPLKVRQGEHSNHDSQHQGDRHSSHRELRGGGSPRGVKESHRDGRGNGPSRRSEHERQNPDEEFCSLDSLISFAAPIVAPTIIPASDSRCGTYRFLRKKYIQGCVFAPYFSHEQESISFATIHTIFGARNASKA